MEIPANLSELSPEALNALKAQLSDAAHGLPENLTAEQLAQLEQMASDFQRVDAEITSRSEAAAAAPQVDEAEIAARAAEARNLLAPPVVEAPVAAAVAPAPSPEPVAEPIPEPVAAASQAVVALAVESDEPTTPSRQVGLFQATHNVKNLPAGSTMDKDALAKAITDARLGFSTISETREPERMTIGLATVEHEIQLPGSDFTVNYPLFGQAVKRVEEATQGFVASGDICDLAAPIYDVTNYSEQQSPMEDALSVVGAPRGAIKWIVPPDWSDARAGVGVTGTGEVGPQSGLDDKPCVHVNCPGTDETAVVAVSTCVEFDNLMYRVFPELVKTFLDQLAANFASVKEVFYLDHIDDDANSTVTEAQTYGTTRFVHRILEQAAYAYRKRYNMSMTTPLDWFAPDFLPKLMRADMVADHSLGMNFLNSTDAQLAAELAAYAGVAVTWYYDSATGEDQSVNGAQITGPLNPYPDNAVTYLEAPGTHVRLDAGTREVGLVRDSVLNRTNDLQLFSEQWINTAKLGSETVKLVLSGLCPTGQGPTPATALTC